MTTQPNHSKWKQATLGVWAMAGAILLASSARLVGSNAWLFSIATVLAAASICDQVIRWSRAREPSWFRRRRAAALLAAAFAALLMVAWPVSGASTGFRGILAAVMSGPLLGLALWTSVLIGFQWTAPREIAGPRRILLVLQALAVSCILAFPAVSLAVLVPDPSSSDLLDFTSIATILAAIASIALMAISVAVASNPGGPQRPPADTQAE